MSSRVPSARPSRVPSFLLSATMALALVGAARAVDPGEILISEMNCIACHDAPAALKTRLASRPSPHLDARNGVRVTPHWLRAFLENPQATQPGTLMPDLLAGLETPARAEAAEALTHYLVSLRGDGQEPPIGSSLAAVNIGRTLYHTVGCVACHAPVEPPPGATASAEVKEQMAKLEKTAIPLGALEKKYTIDALTAFLRDPLKSRPGGRMPSSKLSEGEARAIAAYLLRAQQPSGEAQRLPGLAYDYYEADLPELPEFDRLKPKSSGSTETISTAVAERKNDIALRFHGIIKIAKDGEYEFFTKSDDGSRLYIDEKLVVENGGIHPEQERRGKIKLTTGEHAIRVIYFDGGGNVGLSVAWKGPDFDKRAIDPKVLAHKAQAVRPVGEVEFALEPAKAAKGRELFGSLNCASCHQIDAPGKKAKALGQLTGRQPGGCLSTKAKPGIPKFALTDRQRVVILAQLGNQAGWNEPLAPEQQITRTLTTLNCYACHARERRGGAEGLRREYFANVGEVDLGDEGRIPPTLHGVGAKLRPEWIKTVLVEGGAARPYMATRMPQYGEKNVGHLPELFAKADERPDALPQPDVFAPGVAGDASKFGRKLIGVGGLTCIACHNLDGNKSLGVPAVDLATAGQRLKWDWFRRYLLDPQALRPGTRMPSFWPGGVATNKEVLGGDPEKQIFTVWAYLARKNFTDLPPGLVQGLQELVADKEPVTSIAIMKEPARAPSASATRGEGELAFDADEQRLALIWQGAFIDAAKHRTGRGQGFQKPLGTAVVAGPPGAPFAVLESESAAWPAESGKAAGWQFRGYQFDQQQRPTFRYSWSGVNVEDYPVATTQNHDPGIKRTITLRAAKASRNLYFRAALAEKIVEKDGAFLVAEKVTMKFPGAKPFLRVRDGKTELLVPVTFAGQEAKIVQEIAW